MTICTQDRVCCFGDVIDGKMILNELGKIAHKYWMDIPDIFLHTHLDEFQIMPNHVHGIVVINHSGNHDCSVSDGDCGGGDRDVTRSRLYHHHHNNKIIPPTTTPTIPQPTTQKISPNQHMSNISPKPGSLSVIIGGWKSKCTKEFRETGYTWHGWQSRFHDHIIRNDEALQRIKKYIRSNPENWKG